MLAGISGIQSLEKNEFPYTYLCFDLKFSETIQGFWTDFVFFFRLQSILARKNQSANQFSGALLMIQHTRQGFFFFFLLPSIRYFFYMYISTKIYIVVTHWKPLTDWFLWRKTHCIDPCHAE